MDLASTLAYLIFGLILAWYSWVVWFRAAEFLKWTRTFRSRWYKVPTGGLSKRMYGDQLDRDPKLELWLARIGVVIVYGFVIYVISIYVRAGR